MIRALPLEGTWQVLGVDLFPGVYPQDVVPTWGPAGPESLGFSLYRPPWQVHADLLPFTPVEWYPDTDTSGDPLWSGYTQQAPPGGYGESTQVSCVGWHYYREDAPHPDFWVHDNLPEWRDTRSFEVETLSNWAAGLTLSNDNGVVTLGTANGTTWAAAAAVGVTFDLGPRLRAARVTLAVQRTGGTGVNIGLFVRCHDNLLGTHVSNAGDDAINNYPAETITTNDGGALFVGTPATPRRYVTVFLYNDGGAYTATLDDIWRIYWIRLFADTTYDSNYASSLTADRVVKDSRDRYTPLLSPDNSQITATAYPLKHVAWINEDATAREMQESPNTYHGYRLGVDASKRVFFRAQPSVPRLQIDARGRGVEFRDTSTNDGAELYNYVSVRGQSGSGEPIRLDRHVADVPGLSLTFSPSDVTFVNPSFTTDASGWSGSISRSTTQFLSSPASGQFTGAGNPMFSGSMGPSGTFLAGKPYTLTVWMAWDLSGTVGVLKTMRFTHQFGTSSDYAVTTDVAVGIVGGVGLGPWTKYSLTWVPRASYSAGSVTYRMVRPFVTLTGEAAISQAYIDDGLVSIENRHLLSRQGRLRSFTLNVAASTDSEALAALANAWLIAHQSVPFRASVTVRGAAITDLQTNQQVQADHLGRYYGEMIRVLSVPDPVTGALQSRDGIIASVQGSDPCQLAIDSERRSLEALMARMAVVSG